MTDALRETRRRYMARRREHWRAGGRCLDCGGVRKFPTLRCALCLIGNVIRNDRAVFKKRMATARLRVAS